MPTDSSPWLLLQLADGAFPAGGFAHSAGLEAAVHLGGLQDVEPFVEQVLRQTGRASLPFVRAACECPGDLPALDALFDATLPSPVANRASRAQGRALASAASRIFESPRLAAVVEDARRGPAHHAPVFGAVLGALGVSARDAQIALLHGAARGVLSAGVRLGLLGPLEAQRIQAGLAPHLDEVLAICMHIGVDDAAQTAPLVELYGALHDGLDGRLFQS